MVCGSPSSLIVVLLVVIFVQYHPVGTLNIDDKTGVYYERYPLQTLTKSDDDRKTSNRTSSESTRRGDDDNFSVNCTEPTIQDFPPDMFTQEQRRNGISIFCPREMKIWRNSYPSRRCGGPFHPLCLHHVDDRGRHRRVFRPFTRNYCRRSVNIETLYVPHNKTANIVCTALHMSPDVAGATIMAVGTSSPELFINIVGTFITQGDIGVGTIVGSAAFNILAAPACCGLFTGFVSLLCNKYIELFWLCLSYCIGRAARMVASDTRLRYLRIHRDWTGCRRVGQQDFLVGGHDLRPLLRRLSSRFDKKEQ